MIVGSEETKKLQVQGEHLSCQFGMNITKIRIRGI